MKQEKAQICHTIGSNEMVAYATLLVIAFIIIAYIEMSVWRHKGDLKPNIFPSTSITNKWLFDSGYRIDFDAHESLVISNWITAHQTNWKFGSEDDFNPHKTQFLCDNYIIEINSNAIVFQYYKDEDDMTNNNSDSFIIIKRFLSPDEQAFWKEQVSQIKISNPSWVKLPPIK